MSWLTVNSSSAAPRGCVKLLAAYGGRTRRAPFLGGNLRPWRSSATGALFGRGVGRI